METTHVAAPGLERGASGDFGGRSCSAPPAFRSAPLAAAAGPVPRSSAWATVLGVASLEESESEGWDFEPLSASSSDSSEIPEAILEESSDDDHRPKPQALSGGSETECSGVENSSSLQSEPLTKP